jgi:hypothetical protein
LMLYWLQRHVDTCLRAHLPRPLARTVIHDVRAESHGDAVSEVTFSFTVNPGGGLDFS